MCINVFSDEKKINMKTHILEILINCSVHILTFFILTDE